MEELNDKQKQVKKILLTPIVTNSEVTSIKKNNGIIFSTQKYHSSTKNYDEDMCDFSVGFYEVFYKEMVGGSLLLDNGRLRNKDIAGDTMNTINCICKGESSKEEEKKKNIFYDQYHCLANFWLIPMQHGRLASGKTGKKLNNYDSLILYLHELEKNYNNLKDRRPVYGSGKYKTEYPNYFLNPSLSEYIDFCKVHCVQTISNIESVTTEEYYKNVKCIDIIDKELNIIFKRADEICRDARYESIWDYFNELGLIDV